MSERSGTAAGSATQAALSSLYLRGGTVFIVVAMFGSLVLTQRAASSPLSGAWSGVNDQLIEYGETLSRLFPLGGDARTPGGVRFGSSARISSQWFSDDGVAFVAAVPVDSPLDRWRAATYDQFSLDGWEQTDVLRAPVGAGERLLVGTPEDPIPDLTHEVTVQVQPDAYQDRMMLSPGTPWSVSQDSTVLYGGEAGWFDGVEIADSRTSYTVTARELLLGDTDLISGNRLRQASTDYPASISARYTDVPQGAIGPDAANLLSTILQQAHPDNPYDTAVAIESYLKDGSNFHYQIDVRGVQCSSLSAVECFARTRRGYCLHYASTMAILLRAAYPSQPDPDAAGPGLPAGCAERGDRDGSQPQRARLGRGVLPGLRMDPVRSHGRRRRPALRDPGRARHRQPVAGRTVVRPARTGADAACAEPPGYDRARGTERQPAAPPMRRSRCSSRRCWCWSSVGSPWPRGFAGPAAR